MAKGISRYDEVMSYLRQFNIKNDRMPTRKEIMYEINITQGPLNRILNGLKENKKLIRFPRGVINYKLVELELEKNG